MHNWVAKKPNFKYALRGVKTILNTELAKPPFTSRKSPTMAKMGNSYDLDADEAGLDKKIKILEKHHKIAEKHKMIAELENKTKKLEQEWAVHNFGRPVDSGTSPWLLTIFKDQEIELRT